MRNTFRVSWQQDIKDVDNYDPISNEWTKVPDLYFQGSV